MPIDNRCVYMAHVCFYVCCSDCVGGLYCEAWICRCSCMGSVSVSSCRCCMFVSCVHPVAVLNAAFCMICCYRQTFQAQSLSSSQTTSRDAKPTQHIEITHPNNVNLKLAFHKVASFHPHYSTFTPQTYHHPVHRFRSWPMQMTSQSHPHTQVRVQPRNTYNHTYTKFLPGQN